MGERFLSLFSAEYAKFWIWAYVTGVLFTLYGAGVSIILFLFFAPRHWLHRMEHALLLIASKWSILYEKLFHFFFKKFEKFLSFEMFVLNHFNFDKFYGMYAYIFQNVLEFELGFPGLNMTM